jgi:hypothetical protein
MGGVVKMNFSDPESIPVTDGRKSSPNGHIRLASNVLAELSGGGDMQPGTVRAIEYEIVDKEQIARNGLSGNSLAGQLKASSQLGVLRCVDHQGKKLTFIGHAKHVQNLVASGSASDPCGMALDDRSFPVVIDGWLTSG